MNYIIRLFAHLKVLGTHPDDPDSVASDTALQTDLVSLLTKSRSRSHLWKEMAMKPRQPISNG